MANNDQKPQRPAPEAADYSGLLQSTALEIFMRLQNTRKGYELKGLSEEAFAQAKVFVDEAMRIAGGGAIRDVEIPKRSGRVKVHMWDVLKNTPEYDEHGNPRIVEMEGDPDSHAPNLPPDHPINQRYWLARQVLKMPIPKRYESAMRNHVSAIAEKN